MANLMQKLRRKRKLSSELHSRWGDVSITYPNGGSWNQWDQASAGSRTSNGDHDRRQNSLEPGRCASSPRIGSSVLPASRDVRAQSVDSAMTIPTGYYDARVGSRSRMKQDSYESTSVHPPSAWYHSCSDDGSLEETDGAAAAPSQGGISTGRHQPSFGRPSPYDDAELYSRASKSPPLSVTSRMRGGCSTQGCLVESPVSMPGTFGSRHNSYTSSGQSNPSPAEDPRIPGIIPPSSALAERRASRRSKQELPRAHELVPSYDELYG
ncbi:uncharacterized protein BP01DRAFT_380570 [Aspergillus saccharolyticus JOP 1030-1]|uniref:Uncharacterized protein n=1 Tax=Aspergillus saccharolyticus JOP 1030-1 TaxID=1450539 RepID=A0A318ZLP2_9EURO|nr:hypothetical protein BP01DRAFT_380570 [Aspergillus saccharolyticus JOP 1030-1]PYH47354.1 hypothetical protein BP01DRAFT_380570 [Aspergillus saccharolyticus JOP 1030-1]